MTPETTSTNDKQEDQEKSLSIGAFLKAEREKKGYTLERMISETRLRRYLLEAIEDENWGVLPAPVFVKGFIRSYARVLGLSEEEVVNQYERVGELKESLPQPLTKPIRSRSTGVILVILVLAVIGGTVIFWRSYKTDNLVSGSPGHVSEKRINDLPQVERQQEKTIPPKPEITTELASIGRSGEEKTEDGSHEVAAEIEDLEKLNPAETVTEEKPDKTMTLNPEPANIKFKLKARILEETYVRIYIDDKAPKEYLLQPGARLQWEAEKGFYLTIGNAAGIEFEFEDKLYENLGRHGKVIRLQFPKEFNVNIPEE